MYEASLLLYILRVPNVLMVMASVSPKLYDLFFSRHPRRRGYRAGRLRTRELAQPPQAAAAFAEWPTGDQHACRVRTRTRMKKASATRNCHVELPAWRPRKKERNRRHWCSCEESQQGPERKREHIVACDWILNYRLVGALHPG